MDPYQLRQDYATAPDTTLTLEFTSGHGVIGSSVSPRSILSCDLGGALNEPEEPILTIATLQSSGSTFLDVHFPPRIFEPYTALKAHL